MTWRPIETAPDGPILLDGPLLMMPAIGQRSGRVWVAMVENVPALDKDGDTVLLPMPERWMPLPTT